MKKNRVLALLLALVMVAGLVPMAALAADAATTVTVEADKAVVNQGDTITFTVSIQSTDKLGAIQLYPDIPDGLTYVANSAALVAGTEDALGATERGDEAYFETIGDGVVQLGIVVGSADGLTGITSKRAIATFQCTAEKHGTYAVSMTKGADGTISNTDNQSVEFALAPASVEVKKTIVTPKTLTLSYETLAVTDKSAKSVSPTLTGTDTDDEAIGDSVLAKATYSMPATAGLTIDAATGKITVTDPVAVQAGQVTVTASLTNDGATATGTATLTVTKDASAAATVEVSGDATVIIPAGETSDPAVGSYTAKVFDQYGGEMTGQTITWSATGTSEKVVFDATTAKLTVSNGAAKGTVTVQAACGTVNGKLDVLVTDIAFAKEGKITVKEAPVYGDSWGDIVTIGDITATAGGEVKGTYSIQEGKDTLPGAGPQTYTVVFNSTDKTYTDIVVDTGTVTVAPKEATVTVSDVTVVVNSDMPALTDTETFNYRVEGLVSEDALSGEAVYTFYLIGDTGAAAETATNYADISSAERASYAIRVTGLTAGANYDLKTVDGTLTIRKKNTGGAINVGTGTTPATGSTSTTTMPDGTKVVTSTADDGTVTAEITLPRGAESGKATIHLDNVDSSAVPVIVADDGTETPVKFSAVTEGGVSLVLNQSAKVKIATHDHDFVDTADHWAKDNVRFVHARDIFNGTSETTFSPDAAMTRSMIATVLYRLDGENKSDVAAAFEDVAEGTWYTDGVAWAAEQGVVKGLSDTVFAPEDNVTREQLATMIYRYAGSPAVDSAEIEADFADADSISDWAGDAMQWAIQNGIITGKTGGVLDPQGNATRAEVATILQRFVTLQVK